MITEGEACHVGDVDSPVAGRRVSGSEATARELGTGITHEGGRHLRSDKIDNGPVEVHVEAVPLDEPIWLRYLVDDDVDGAGLVGKGARDRDVGQGVVDGAEEVDAIAGTRIVAGRVHIDGNLFHRSRDRVSDPGVRMYGLAA